MNIFNKVKTLVGPIVIPIAIVLGMGTGGNFYFHHNVNYEEDGKKVFQKVDGIFDYTELNINEGGSVDVIRHSLVNYRSYTDKDGDEIVDRVFHGSNLFVRGSGSHSRMFLRDEHLEQYPQVFEKADQDFREQMKRFKPYINR